MNEFTTELINRDNIVLLDGATGTELEKNGVIMDPVCWSGFSGYTNPDILESIHAKYIIAGARVITTNTFASSRINIENTNKKLNVEEVNLKTIDCAINARNKSNNSNVKIAGSMSLSFIENRYEFPLSESIGSYTYDELLINYREQVEFFLEKKID